jgi:hypothetical protein
MASSPITDTGTVPSFCARLILEPVTTTSSIAGAPLAVLSGCATTLEAELINKLAIARRTMMYKGFSREPGDLSVTGVTVVMLDIEMRKGREFIVLDSI